MESPHKTLPTCQLLPTLKLSSPSLTRPFTESMSATMSTFIGCPVFSLSCFKPNGFLSRRFDKANFASLLIKSYVNIMGPIMCGKFFVAIFCQKYQMRNRHGGHLHLHLEFVAFGRRSVTKTGTTCCCGLGFRVAKYRHVSHVQNIDTTVILITASCLRYHSWAN